MDVANPEIKYVCKLGIYVLLQPASFIKGRHNAAIHRFPASLNDAAMQLCLCFLIVNRMNLIYYVRNLRGLARTYAGIFNSICINISLSWLWKVIHKNKISDTQILGLHMIWSLFPMTLVGWIRPSQECIQTLDFYMYILVASWYENISSFHRNGVCR